ncbi:MAG: two-component regulator propeller domain-containing protein [Bacteroidota bacterium]
MKLNYKIALIIAFNCLNLWGQEIIPNPNDLSFKHMSSSDGLSQRSISDILQDGKGYLWFGTRDGLNKYDGDKITIYRHNSEDTTSLTHSWIRCLFEDTENNIWIGTKEGLNKYNPKKDNFIQYTYNKNLKGLLDNEIWNITQLNDSLLGIATNKGLNFIDLTSENFSASRSGIEPLKEIFVNNKVRDLLTTKNGDLWICTVDAIGIYNPQTNKIINIDYPEHSIKESYLNNPPILFEDSQGNIWIGYDKGLAIFNKDLRVFNDYTFNDKTLMNSAVRTICEDSYGNLWVGTYDGLFILNIITQKLFHVKHNKNNPKSLSQNSIYKIIKDSKGDMWIGTWAGGVNYFDRSYAIFDNIISGDGENMINYNIVSGIVEDNYENLWIGTEGGGINYYDKGNDRFTYYVYNSEDRNSVSSNNVKSIIIDKEGNLWIGTHDNGLNFLDTNKTPLKFKRITPRDQESKLLSDYKILSLFEDNNGNVWIGTLTRGLLLYNPKLKTLQKISNDNKSIQCIVASTVQDYIIVGGSDGIEKVNINTFRQEKLQWLSTKRNGDYLSVNSIFVDDKNNYWIGTEGSGLFHYQSNTQKLTKYGIPQGLPNEVVYGILQDDNGYFWISTNKGLSRFNLATKSFKNFTKSDGLQSNEFNYQAYTKTSNRELIFGGVDGITIFNPDKIDKNAFIPNVDIYEIEVNNETFSRIDNSGSTIKLKHNENNFSISYTALGFSQPNKNKYAYKLEGFDKDWVYIDNKKTATYTNIEDGEYIFKVKASNSDGLWNEIGDSVKIKVRPPVWRTWWAYLIYGLISIGLAYYIRTLILARVQVKKQLEEERIEKEKIEGINKLKLKFFTNISHEFRTPLTLILGPLQRLARNTGYDKETKTQIELIQRNAITLLELINQLLNFRKSEAGELKLQVSQNNIINFINEIKLSFDELAKNRNIKFNFNYEAEKIDIWFDAIELKKVIINILSNAFKFTPNGGEIIIKVDTPKLNTDTIEISIKDSGIGIPKEKIKYIFDRYFQLGVSKGKRVGTGLGLSLAKDIIEMHSGNIKVESEKGAGVEFTIALPLGKEHLNTEKIEVQQEEFVDMGFDYDPVMSLPEVFDTGEHDADSTEIIDNSIPSILIIEDNNQLRRFIKSIFEDRFNVYLAGNGEEGLNLAETKNIDLIISDIMMPIMNGIDMCHKIKSNIKTSHIPIILLTAKTSLNTQREGYKTGADVYVTKPFNAEILYFQVKNLFNLRNKAIEKFKKDAILTPKVLLTHVSMDEKFLEKAFGIVEKYMEDNSFNAQKFTEKMGVSRTLLYNKLKSLTGQSLTEFIRLIRLKKAAQLITSTEMNISEIAYEVGFNDLKYFRTNFKTIYNTTPTTYRKANKTQKNSKD